MKRMTFGLAALALLGGCATPQMKSTPFYSGSSAAYAGDAKDRINLWPLAYYRDPACSVLWPLFSVTDEHLAVRPLYSQFRQNGAGSSYDEFNILWPICQFDTRRNAHRIFPIFWGARYFNVIPLWCSGRRYKMLFPIFFQEDDSLQVYPLFGRKRLGKNGFSNWYGLYGHSRSGEKWSDWCVPFYYRDNDSFNTPLFGWNRTEGSCWTFPFAYRGQEAIYSAVWCSWRNEQKKCDNWFVPPLLSWGWSTDSAYGQRYLLGLAGIRRNGRFDSSDWLMPLYYRDENCFRSLLWCSHDGGYDIPLLLTSVRKHAVITPVWGHGESFTYVTPFVGVTHSEHRNGAWLWPLFGWASDDRMGDAEKMLAAETLDPKISVAKRGKNQCYTLEGVDKYIEDDSWSLSGLSTSDRRIRWAADKETVTAKDSSDIGNFLAYKVKKSRTVKFDAKTREKVSDEENGESGLLCNFLWHSKHESSKGHEYVMKSILWRCWHYEKQEDDVSVDSFPFFTYDLKANGYSKTSLCWRLFRNEYDPKTDERAIDFLFIPVWR